MGFLLQQQMSGFGNLKSEGAIRRIAAVVESHFMQFSLVAFIFVLVGGKDNTLLILTHTNIFECHHMTGEYSYIRTM